MNKKDGQDVQNGQVIIFAACPTCKSPEIEPFVKYNSFPAVIFPVDDKNGAIVNESAINSFYCKECGHIFLNQINSVFLKSIYKDYYQFYPFQSLDSMQEPYRQPFEKVADIFLTKHAATLLEIGCDNIAQMEFFLKKNYRCTAISPGAKASAYSHVNFIDGYYGESDVDGCFDYIISRFNLEHVIDLDAFFDAIDKNIAPHGIVIIQVPNTTNIISSGILNIIAHEHPHNFCHSSLLAILRRRDYQILHLSHEGSPSLICVFSKCATKNDPHYAIKKNKETIKKIRSLLLRKQGQPVLFYGASLSLSAILYSGIIDDSLLSNVQIVDDNPIIEGRIMPNTRLRVQLFDKIQLSSFAIIVLTMNEIYHEKVLNRIKAHKDFEEIYAIGKEGITLLS